MVRTFALAIKALALGLLVWCQGLGVPAAANVPGAPPVTLTYYYPTLNATVDRKITEDYVTIAIFGVPLPRGFENLPQLRGVSFAIEPALPPGFQFNPANGDITTPTFPTAPAATTTYVTTVTTPFGSTQAKVVLTVKNLPPTLTYASATEVAIQGGSFTDAATLGGGAVTSVSVAPSLPAWLSLNPTTLALTGSPTATTPLGTVAYTVTATNSGGSAHATVAVTVDEPPPSVSYNGFSAKVGVQVMASPSLGSGVVTSYSGTLPPGLTVNAATGLISGIPTAAGSGTYTVAVTYPGGTEPVPVAITVDPEDLAFVAPPRWLTTGASASATVTAAMGGQYLESGNTFTWTGTDCFILSGQGTPTISYQAGIPGTLTLTCVETAGSLASSPVTAAPTVLAPAQATIFAQPKMHAGDNFPVSLPAPGIVSWSWNPLNSTLASFTGANLGLDMLIVNATAPSAGGGFTLGAAVSDETGASASASATISVVQQDYASPGEVSGNWGPGVAAVLLPTGRVLVVGRSTQPNLYDPATDTWKPAATMLHQHVFGHGLTVLADGKALVTGGFDFSTFADSRNAEVYDPVTDTWTDVGPMTVARQAHTATLLQNGQVLVAGGTNGSSDQGLELYTPGGGWQAVPVPSNPLAAFIPRDSHTATLLGNGNVLFAGGNGALTSAQVYNLSSNACLSSSLNAARMNQTATLLQDGTVLLAGGSNGGVAAQQSAERYAPSSNTWTPTGQPMTTPRYSHGAALLADGTVLVLGGTNGNEGGGFALASSERYDPAQDTWTAQQPLGSARIQPATVALADGRVFTISGSQRTGAAVLSSPELFTLGGSPQWLYSGGAQARYLHTATLLPDGSVLMAGGSTDNAGASASTQIYTPASTSTLTYTSGLNQWTGPLAPSASMATPRRLHTATLLPDGTVLVAGGDATTTGILYPGNALASVERYQPGANTWVTAPAMAQARAGHTATALDQNVPVAGVLVVGGTATSPAGDGGGQDALASVEFFDGSQWHGGTGSTPRALHAAAFCPGSSVGIGTVLVLGGMDDNDNLLPSVDEFFTDGSGNPQAVSPAPASLNTPRCGHTATTLANGKVLVVGGLAGSPGLDIYGSPVIGQAQSVELYDPTVSPHTCTTIAGLHYPRALHTATLLADGTGRVLVTGGMDSMGNPVPFGELFDPGTGQWTVVGSLGSPRCVHTATALPDGSVAVFGGTYSFADDIGAPQGNLELWK